MFSTCIFCHADLGRNEVVERFPVGRRLAFDAAKGRLWVVCKRCGRWNLTPLEERWEAIEECEQLFRGTRLRASTDNIGLAKLREGLELVRVGEPLRPELAVWRYGDQLGKRRRRMLAQVGLGLGAVGAVVVGGAVAGVGLGGFYWLLHSATRRIIRGNPEAEIARLATADGQRISVRREHLDDMRLVAGEARGGFGGAPPETWSLNVRHAKGSVYLTGAEALRAAGQLLPQVNRFGASKRQVVDAVDLLERVSSPPAAFAEATKMLRGTGTAAVRSLPDPVRLALEMAAHEETERRALEGELAQLEAAWREAEEVAAIADNLFLPRSVEEFLAKYR